MGLILVKDGTTDEYSTGDGLDPIQGGTVVLNDTSTPPTYDNNAVETDLYATTYLYTGISLSLLTETAGIDYKLSLNNVNYFETLTSGAGGAAVGQIADMDATGGAVRTAVWVRATVSNDGSVAPGPNVTCDVSLVATENQ